MKIKFSSSWIFYGALLLFTLIHTRKREKKIKCKLRNFNSLWGRRNAVASAPPSAFAAAFVYDSFAHSTSSDRVHATTTTTLAFDSIYSDFFLCSSHQLLLINIAVIQLQLGGLRHYSLQLFRLDLNTTPHIHTWKLRQKTRPSTTGGGWKVAAKKSFFLSAQRTRKKHFLTTWMFHGFSRSNNWTAHNLGVLWFACAIDLVIHFTLEWAFFEFNFAMRPTNRISHSRLSDVYSERYIVCGWKNIRTEKLIWILKSRWNLNF